MTVQRRTFISRRYLNTDFPLPLNIDNAITIFEDQVYSWFIQPGYEIAKNVHADFILLMVIASYFEPFEMFSRGEDSDKDSKSFFISAFKKVVPLEKHSTDSDAPQPVSDEEIEAIGEAFYKNMRCGLFHIGLTRYGIELSRTPPDNFPGSALWIEKTENGGYYASINAPALLDVINSHFREYMAVLRNPRNTVERENFRAAWNIRVGEDPTLKIP